ncbi:CDGSH iron-sulfur domain-containing protein [Thiohalobacter sp. IOR34]|uniref:CDGSH iron-sulfur domain-containing protein n=1 Tax=Thiohalobacter sp. IOR34 TaxID=3057176 RepID=UPI00339D62C0
MTEPIIVQKKPHVLELDAGSYYWCACGRSKNPPFCDGSHQGTGLEPIHFELSEPTKVWLCGCKHSARPPFCDGAHKRL